LGDERRQNEKDVKEGKAVVGGNGAGIFVSGNGGVTVVGRKYQPQLTFLRLPGGRKNSKKKTGKKQRSAQQRSSDGQRTPKGDGVFLNIQKRREGCGLDESDPKEEGMRRGKRNVIFKRPAGGKQYLQERGCTVSI